MTDRTTINVSKEAHREAQEAKEEGETWSDYLLRSTDEEAVRTETDVDFEELMNELSMASDPTVEIDVEGMMREIKKAQEMAEQARDNTEDIKRGLGR